MHDATIDTIDLNRAMIDASCSSPANTSNTHYMLDKIMNAPVLLFLRKSQRNIKRTCTSRGMFIFITRITFLAMHCKPPLA